jgi:hypothetical protein
VDAVVGLAHRSPIDLVLKERPMIRTLTAWAVLGAAVIALGNDLAQTAYSATQTAQTVTLASLDRS